MKLLKRDVLKATVSLQLFAVQNASNEAAIHTVYKNTFNKENTKAVLMVNVSNAFTVINWEAFLHNSKKLCPSVST